MTDRCATTCRSSAAALGLSGRLHLTGVRDDVPDLLPGFDVFVLSSRWEGLPRVIPQAMAAGLPVVATAVDGSVEAVRDSGAGLLVEPGDAAGLADAVRRLVDDDQLRSECAAQGRRHVPEFSIETMIRQLEELYGELLARPAPSEQDEDR